MTKEQLKKKGGAKNENMKSIWAVDVLVLLAALFL